MIRLSTKSFTFTLVLSCIFLLLGLEEGESSQNVLSATTTEVPPKIDGFIEETWTKANLATGFTQVKPDEGKPATEETVVYVIYDEKNLYIAFKCYDSEPDKLILETSFRDNVKGDSVRLFLDTFGDGLTAYYFSVSAAGVEEDGILSQDGRVWDNRWDGVWYSEAKVTDFGFSVEIKIPFKSIRFKRELTSWGIDFSRVIFRKDEEVYWAPQKREEGFRVSRSGKLINLSVEKVGFHIEAYPVVPIKYGEGSIEVSGGFDFNWYLTPSSTASLTLNPDFAQIESDPYRVNLSKYELYFNERRPFFIEDSEIFSPQGLALFYSRRIGKRLPDGKDVPILGALKFQEKFRKFEVGAIGAITKETKSVMGENSFTEPQSYYSVLRLNRQFFENSSLGLLYAEKFAEGSSNRALGIDGAIRTTELQFGFQLAHSEKGGKDDYSIYSGISIRKRRFRVDGYYQHIGKNFDISEIGFAPWAGTEEYELAGGPVWHQKWILKRLHIRFRAAGFREEIEPGPGYIFSSIFDFNFRNNWTFIPGISFEKDYEMEEWYNSRNIGFGAKSSPSKPLRANFSFWYRSKQYNYRREYFAPNSTGQLNIIWRIKPWMILGFDVNNTIEFQPNGRIEQISWVLHPTMQIAFSKDFLLRVWSEPNTDTHVHRLNLLLSWNFKPKSWIYFALNETRDNQKGNMRLKERIVVLKMKYLFVL